LSVRFCCLFYFVELKIVLFDKIYFMFSEVDDFNDFNSSDFSLSNLNMIGEIGVFVS